MVSKFFKVITFVAVTVVISLLVLKYVFHIDVEIPFIRLPFMNLMGF